MDDRGRQEYGLGGYLRGLVQRTVWFLIILLASVTIYLGLTTVDSLYRGERAIGRALSVAGVARVGHCESLGPLSVYGFGYWWRCQIEVTFADGRHAEGTVGASIAAPRDRSEGFAIVEECSNPSRTNCEYFRPGNLGIAIAVRLLTILRKTVLVVGVLIAGLALLRGLLGQRLYARLLRIPQRSDQKTRDRGDIEPTSDVPNAVSGSDWAQSIRITFTYSHGAFEDVYRSTRPRLRIDGRDQPVEGWGTQGYSLPAGRHRIQIDVPFGDNHGFGGAATNVTLVSGVNTNIEYVAPKAPNLPGVFRAAADRK